MARRSAHQLFRAPWLLFPRVRLLQRVVLLVLCLSVLQRVSLLTFRARVPLPRPLRALPGKF